MREQVSETTKGVLGSFYSGARHNIQKEATSSKRDECNADAINNAIDEKIDSQKQRGLFVFVHLALDWQALPNQTQYMS
jgi:hypothetical protein